MTNTIRFTGSADINGPIAARAYLKRRAHDAIQCWKSFTQEQRDQHHVVSFAKHLAKFW